MINMNRCILLLKNKKLVISNNISDYYSDIELILFPCDIELNTYLLHEKNQFMCEMVRAEIKIESILYYFDEDYEVTITPITKTKKQINTYVELIQYLFSLDKIKYYNGIIRDSDYGNLPPYEIIEFCYFKIKVYDKREKVIYKKEISLEEKIKHHKIYVNEFFEPENILSNIRDIYFPEISLFKDYLSIDIDQFLWDMGNHKYKYSTCGLYFEETNSLSFFSYEDIVYLKKIHSLYSIGTVFELYENIDDVKEAKDPREFLEECIYDKRYDHIDRTYDQWYFSPTYAVEFVTYLPYITMIMKMNTSIVDQTNDIESYHMRHILSIEIYKKEINAAYTDKKPFTINDLIQICKGEKNDCVI